MTIPNSSYLKNSLSSLAAAVILIFAISCEKEKEKVKISQDETHQNTLKTIESIESDFKSSLANFKQKTDSLKRQMIPNVIKESGFIKLPLVFDADIDNLKLNYRINYKSNDTLLFEGVMDGIIGFLPDTTNYYAFLYYTIGDMLYPTIQTMDKNWQKIDNKIICATGCSGHVQLNITSCYDSVKIFKDFKIKSISRAVGTVEDEDLASHILNICNTRILDGLIDKNGKINIKNSGLMNCDADTENAIR
jgi:hypothetical protein